MIGLVAKTGVTAWDVALKMFPKADDVHRFLSVSEAVAHLDMAHTEGKIAFELNGQRDLQAPKLKRIHGVARHGAGKICATDPAAATFPAPIFLEPPPSSRVRRKLFRRKFCMKAKYSARSPARYNSDCGHRARPATRAARLRHPQPTSNLSNTTFHSSSTAADFSVFTLKTSAAKTWAATT